MYSKCLIRKFNSVDENGNFNENVIRELTSLYLDENEVNQLVTECSSYFNTSDDDINLKFSKLMKCFEKYKTMKGILNF